MATPSIARASHQRRPTTYRVTGRDGAIYFLDSCRDVTHAVIGTRRGSLDDAAVACVGLEEATRTAERWRAGITWDHVEIVTLSIPAPEAR